MQGGVGLNGTSLSAPGSQATAQARQADAAKKIIPKKPGSRPDKPAVEKVTVFGMQSPLSMVGFMMLS